MGRFARLSRRPLAWAVLAALIGVAAVGLELFQPWRLWIDRTVDEAAPATAAPTTAIPATATPATAASATVTVAPPGGARNPGGPAPVTGPAVLARGTLISHEHTTTGTVRILAAADGTRYLRLENLDTSDGPQLEVWLTDAAVIAGPGGWYLFDDGLHVSLGPLKGNKGSQNYPLPAGLDLGRYRSVSIWCARFHVSFGAAELTA